MGNFDFLNIDEEDSLQQQGTLAGPSRKEGGAVASSSATAASSSHTSSTHKQSSGQKKNDLPELPLLVPVGDLHISTAAPINTLALHLEPMIVKKEAEELSYKEKELGNRAFSEGNFALALMHYSHAIRLNWRESVFFSNRALVYLKLARYYECISDCTASIDRKPSIKAYARRAQAWAAVEEFYWAAEDYKKALKFEQKNTECLTELEQCLVKLEQDYRNKLFVEPNNDKLKTSLHNVREDLKKIASKIDTSTNLLPPTKTPMPKG